MWVLYVVRQRSLRRADHSSRGVLPSAKRLSVMNPRQSGDLGPLELLRHGYKKMDLNLSLCLTKRHNIIVCGNVETYLHALLASEVDANCVQLNDFADSCAGNYYYYYHHYLLYEVYLYIYS
jgi:hypothetical protein